MVIAMQNQFNDEYMNNDNYAIDSVTNTGKNYTINNSMDVDVNLDVLKTAGITEDEIDEMFNLDDDAINSSIIALDKNDKKQIEKLKKLSSKSKKKLEDDIILVKKFVDNLSLIHI